MARPIIILAVLASVLTVARLAVPPHTEDSLLPVGVPVRIWFVARASADTGRSSSRLGVVGWAAEGRRHLADSTLEVAGARDSRLQGAWRRLSPGQRGSGRGVVLPATGGSSMSFVPSTSPSPLGRSWADPQAVAELANERLRLLLMARLTQPAAGLAAARILGRRDRLARETWVSYRDAGILHVLAISGLHLALLGAFLGALLRWLGLPLRARTALLIAVVAGYAILVGARPPVVRAAVMVSVVSAACLCRRRPDTWAAYWTALVVCLLLEPQWLLTPGFQLSFVAVAAILYSRRGPGVDPEESLTAALLTHRPGRLRRGVTGGLYITAAVTVVMDPLLAFHFQRVNMATFPGNMIVLPVASVVLALSWCAMLPLVGSAFAVLTEHATAVELAAAGLVAGIPAMRAIVRPPSLLELAAYYAALALIVRLAPRPGACALLFYLVATLAVIVRPPATMDEVLWQGSYRSHVEIVDGDVTVDTTSPYPRGVGRRLSRRGVRHVDLLILAPTIRRDGWRRALADEGIQVVSVMGGR